MWIRQQKKSAERWVLQVTDLTEGSASSMDIYLNGSPLEENGVYTDPTARKLCAELGIEGY